MPRIGSTKKSGDKSQSEIVQALTDDAYNGLADHVREAKAAAALGILDEIKRIQSTTHDKYGKLKRAKFKAACLALRWEGFSPKQTSEVLGVGIHRVTKALTDLRKNASIDEQIDRIDQQVVPLAVDNLVRGVLEGDKEYTLKVLDGRGVFLSHKSVTKRVKKTVLTMHVTATLPDGHQPSLPKQGSIVGAQALPPAKKTEPMTVETPAGDTLAVVER